MGPAFDVRGLLVWGFTAGMLDTLLDLGGWTKPWDAGRGSSICPRRHADDCPPVRD